MAPDAQTVAEAYALVQAQAAARQELTQLTTATVRAEVAAFTGWYSSPAITGLAGKLARITAAAQRQTATSTDAFAIRVLLLLTGRRPRTRPIAVEGLRGVPLDSVYGRLADQYRWLEATRGVSAPAGLLERPDRAPLPRLSPDAILDRVLDRVEVQVDDNLALAFRDQWAADIAGEPQVTGYRRIIHPEVVATGSAAPGPVCGLCAVVATRLYRKSDLLPLHARCRCTVLPVVGDEDGDGDPGLVLNRRDLRALYAAAGSTAAAKLKATRWRVVQDGELGPRLMYADQEHRSPAAVAADDVVPPGDAAA